MHYAFPRCTKEIKEFKKIFSHLYAEKLYFSTTRETFNVNCLYVHERIIILRVCVCVKLFVVAVETAESQSFLPFCRTAIFPQYTTQHHSVLRVLKPKLRMPFSFHSFLCSYMCVCVCVCVRALRLMCNNSNNKQRVFIMHESCCLLLLLLLKRNITKLSWRCGEILPSTPIHRHAI